MKHTIDSDTNVWIFALAAMLIITPFAFGAAEIASSANYLPTVTSALADDAEADQYNVEGMP